MLVVLMILGIILLCGIFSRSKLPNEEKQRRWEMEQNRTPFAGLLILALIIVPIIVLSLG